MNNKLNYDLRIIYSILISLLLILFTSTLLYSSEFSIKSIRSNLENDLVIVEDYIVSGNESWRNITVKSTGKLIVPKEAKLEANNIFLENFSIVEISGGSVQLKNIINSGSVSFNGTCNYLNLTDGGEISIIGSNGWANTSINGPLTDFISTSRGGNAIFNITVDKGILIRDSIINVQGGNGFDLPESTNISCNAWKIGGNLTGYVGSGGNATFSISYLNNSNLALFEKVNINVAGGEGGNAADGGKGEWLTRGKGGGYNNGGNVSGFVGTGGYALIKINTDSNLNFINSSISSIAGEGGAAGKGGNGSRHGWGKGGGGGGYTGDSGYEISVKDFVGSGGNSQIELNASKISIFNTFFTSHAGNGGDGGSGGTGGHNCGGGGGGYGGGKGGDNRNNANNGNVDGFVGSGGHSNLFVYSKDLIMKNYSLFKSTGGTGGFAGDGGMAVTTGGGGGGGYNRENGNGSVKSSVAKGGNSTIIVVTKNLFEFIDQSNIFIKAGNGGNAGDGGGSGSTGGSGGGGYGGGGGGYWKAGNGSVIGEVGNGGHCLIDIISEQMYVDNSTIKLLAGNGGQAGNGGHARDNGGSSGGGGGGYGGGGGIGDYTSGDHLNNIDYGKGNVEGSVGSGGNTTFKINSNHIVFSSLSFSIKGGNGGNAGNGGNGYHFYATGGGGGFGGGGGISVDGKGGNGIVIGNISRGGNSLFLINSNHLLITKSILSSEGGDGGNGGLGGDTNDSNYCGAGGGGYGGGGGGKRAKGGYGYISGNIGDGGNSNLSLNANTLSISNSSCIQSIFGNGGIAPTSPGGPEKFAGEGTGRITSNGKSYIYPSYLLDIDFDCIPDIYDDDDDGDRYLDSWENLLYSDPKDPNSIPLDTDMDKRPDGDQENSEIWMDNDDDNDFLLDIDELIIGTNPSSKDTDDDGYVDHIDEYPLNSNKWKSDKGNNDDNNTGFINYPNLSLINLLTLALIFILLAIIIIFIAIIDKKEYPKNNTSYKPPPVPQSKPIPKNGED